METPTKWRLLIVMTCIVLLIGISGISSAELNGEMNANKPLISFTSVPSPGSHDYVSGMVLGVPISEFEVALYIYVPGYGWVNKPNWDEPRTSIRSDGTWTSDYTTGGHDEDATQFMAFLVPKGYQVPILAGSSKIPTSLYQFQYAQNYR